MSEKTVQTEKINSLGELIEKATPKTPDAESGRLRDCAVYRGMLDADWHLLTSLDRLGCPPDPPHSKSHLEEHLLRNFMRYARPYLQLSPINEWEGLVVAQHHGLPTRLLDWTYSPLVAAHFAALGGNPKKDRAVWKLDWQQVHKHFDTPPIALTVENLEARLRAKGFNGIWSLFSPQEYTTIPSFMYMLEPPTLDARISVQSATFTLCSDKSRPLDEILLGNNLSHTITKFVIPASKVEYFRDQLDLCSIDERRLFPDLEGVTREMKRYYSTSSKKR